MVKYRFLYDRLLLSSNIFIVIRNRNFDIGIVFIFHLILEEELRRKKERTETETGPLKEPLEQEQGILGGPGLPGDDLAVLRGLGLAMTLLPGVVVAEAEEARVVVVERGVTRSPTR